MGQYYYPTNLDKKQYLHPHAFGDGLKLMEFGASGCGTMMALAILLADGNGQGGGDFSNEEGSPLVGSWAGDRIVVAGDYAEEGKFVKDKKKNLHTIAGESFQNISFDILVVMLKDKWIRKDFEEKRKFGGGVIEDALKLYNVKDKDLPLWLGSDKLETEEAKDFVARKIKESNHG